MVDDEHELYRVMMSDLFESKKYDVEEIKRVCMPKYIRALHDIHYSRRVNKFFEMPAKSIWDHWYLLDKYTFDSNEKYTVLFMNGSLRNFFNKKYLIKLRKKHPNVKLCLLIFDKSIYYGAKRAIEMRECFDYIFSFDSGDCEKYGFLKFYNCFSSPPNIEKDKNKESDAFFIGNAGGRLEKLQETFAYILKEDSNCKFFITGVDKQLQKSISNITYNQQMTFDEEMSYSYNSNCLIEILRDGQTGISLRVCEAITFNKKLLTNNENLKNEKFYDARYMKIFKTPNDIDVNFLKDKIEVKYEDTNIFSPLRICDKIMEMENEDE